MDSFVREGVIRLRTELVETKLQAPDISEMTESIEESNQRTREAVEQTTKLAEETEKLAEVRTDAEERNQAELAESNRLREEVVEQQRQMSEEAIRLGGSLRTAGDGAFTLARGLALSSLEGSRGLEETLETIARVQGQFDLFRGAVDTFAGATEAAKSANSLVSLARESDKNFKQVRSTLTTVVGFLGPAGTIAVGAAAAAGAIAIVYTALADESESAVDRAQKRLDEFIENARRQNEQLQLEFEASATERRFQDTEGQIATLEKNLASVRDRSGESTFAEDQAAIDARAAAQRDFEQLRREAATGPRFGNTPEADARRQESIQQREAARERLEGLGGAVTEPERQQLLEQGEQLLELQREELRIQNEISDAVKRRGEEQNRLAKSRLAQEKRELEEVENRRKRLQSELENEQKVQAQRERDAAIQLGNLTPGERNRLEAGLGRLERDEDLTPEFLRQFSGIAPAITGPAVEAFRARRAGVEPINPNAEVDRLRAALDRLTASIEKEQGDVRRAQDNVTQTELESTRLAAEAAQASLDLAQLVKQLGTELIDLKAQLAEAGGR